MLLLQPELKLGHTETEIRARICLQILKEYINIDSLKMTFNKHYQSK